MFTNQATFLQQSCYRTVKIFAASKREVTKSYKSYLYVKCQRQDLRKFIFDLNCVVDTTT